MYHIMLTQLLYTNGFNSSYSEGFATILILVEELCFLWTDHGPVFTAGLFAILLSFRNMP